MPTKICFLASPFFLKFGSLLEFYKLVQLPGAVPLQAGTVTRGKGTRMQPFIYRVILEIFPYPDEIKKTKNWKRDRFIKLTGGFKAIAVWRRNQNSFPSNECDDIFKSISFNLLKSVFFFEFGTGWGGKRVAWKCLLHESAVAKKKIKKASEKMTLFCLFWAQSWSWTCCHGNVVRWPGKPTAGSDWLACQGFSAYFINLCWGNSYRQQNCSINRLLSQLLHSGQ